MHQETIQRIEGGRRTRGDAPDRKPLVSIITVVFNGGEAFAPTMDSVLFQSYIDYEWIVVDGGSTDGTVQQIVSREDKIDYWLSEPDRGIYDAMNKALTLARGTWVYFLNSGDTFVNPYILAQVAAVLTETAAEIVVGYVRVVSAGILKGRFPLDFVDTKTARKLFRNRFCHQALFVRHQSYSAVGGFDLTFPTFADFQACYKIVRKAGGFERCNIEIANFDLGGVSSDYRRSAELYMERESLFEGCGEGKTRLSYLAGLLRAHAYRYKRSIQEKRPWI
ncbi:MAG: glycosyltransferase family 2 protein [Acidobacteriaceae bacterium]